MPYFIDLSHALHLHQSLIENYGGDIGVRDMGLLESALAMPQASYDGKMLHNNLFEMAAAYLYHIVQNHPFVDGNKRVGAASAIIFLSMNDIEIENDEDGLIEITMAVARSETGKSEIAAFFKKQQL